MRILVNLGEIDAFKKNIMMYINNIDKDISIMEKIKNNLIWEGKSFDTFIKKYDDNILKIKNKVNILTKYVEFLDVYNSKYNKTQDEIKVNYSKMKGKNNGK